MAEALPLTAGGDAAAAQRAEDVRESLEMLKPRVSPEEPKPSVASVILLVGNAFGEVREEKICLGL